MPSDTIQPGKSPRHEHCCAQVRYNVQAALEGLGLVPSDTREKEAEALQGVQDILRPVLNRTWPSGLPENN